MAIYRDRYWDATTDVKRTKGESGRKTFTTETFFLLEKLCRLELQIKFLE
jgi:hypothetical protein